MLFEIQGGTMTFPCQHQCFEFTYIILFEHFLCKMIIFTCNFQWHPKFCTLSVSQPIILQKNVINDYYI